MSSFSNNTKRRITCQFCPKLPSCKSKCKKFWKEIYRNNREAILAIHSEEKLNLQQSE